jgi:hypothetical protein
MSNSKISALTSATTPLAGTETLPVVQSGATTKVTVANLTAGRDVVTNSVSVAAGVPVYLNGTSGNTQILYYASLVIDMQINGTKGFRLYAPGAGTSELRGDWTTTTSSGGSGNFTVLGNVVQGTAAKGINFTANTPATGMTSQLLNWYEEGVVTAAITTTSGSITLNASFNKIKYTRIGRSVSITGVLYVDSVSTPGGAATITGLPFANGSAKSNVAGVCIFATGLAVTATTAIQGRIEDSATGIILEKFTAGASTSIVGDIQAATQFKLNATYFV